MPVTPYPLRVLLLEDLPRWQIAISSLVEVLPSTDVVGVVDSYDSVIHLLKTLPENKKPNLALLDYQVVGEKTGLDVAYMLCECGLLPEQIIMVSSSPAQIFREHPFGYTSKQQAVESLPILIEGVRALLAGGFGSPVKI